MPARLVKPETQDSLALPFGVVNYRLKRSSRRQSIEISISETYGLCVAAPRYLPDEAIRRFIVEKSSWIAKRLKEWEFLRQHSRHKSYESGQEFLFLGIKYPLTVRPGEVRLCQVVFDGARWVAVVPATALASHWPKLIKAKLIQWYRRQASEVFAGRVFEYSRLMGLEPRKITVKTQKRLWGSCAQHNKSINLNWQLIMAPLEVLDYVAVHELCHLKIADHSKRFWAMVADVLPDYRRRQQWLKTNRPDMILP